MKKQNENWSLTTKKNTVNLAYWTGAWMITMAVASFGPKFIWNFNSAVSISAILINTGIGIGMIIANKRHLNGLDEMQRKIQLEAMALSLGVAVVGGLSYSMLDITNIISYDAEISHLVIIIGLTYFAATIIGQFRYR